MKTIASVLGLPLIFCLSLLPGCSPDSAGDAAKGSATVDEIAPVTTTLFGEKVLLFMEHPPLVRGEPARFLVHLSVLATGEPVRTGRVTLSIGTTNLIAEGPKRDGLFVPEGGVESAGRLPAKLVVTSEQAQETLDLGEVVVHATSAEARHTAESDVAEDPAGAVPFLMEQQWKISLLLFEAEPRTLSRRLAVPAQTRSPEGAEAVVIPPTAGRLSAPESGRWLRSGDTVEVGQILAYVEPLLGAADTAQIQALQLEFDLKALDVVRATGEAAARLDFAQRERERIAKLREHGLSTAQQLDEAERDLALAKSAAEAARATKTSLDLIQSGRNEASEGSKGRASRLPIASPLRGTVISATRVAGEIVEASEVLFRIRDTSRLWVEGRVSEYDLPLLGDSASAVLTLIGLPDARFELGGAAGALMILPTVDPVSRTAVLRGEIVNATGSIQSGMLGELQIATATIGAQVVVPVEAVVMDQGLPTAYVMLEGELFQKRDLELGVTDRGFVEVRRGLSAGERVATRGAYLVKLAAASPASFGAGHQH